jgi:hypothetical protein
MRFTTSGLFAAIAICAPLAFGSARQLPLSAFLDAQGTRSTVWPTVPDFFGWTAPAPGVKTPADSYVGGNGGSCDYAGIVGKWLAANHGPVIKTTYRGSLTQWPLEDGRIKVQLELQTANAFAIGSRIVAAPYGNWATDPIIFGAHPQDVLLGATPAIGECHASFAWKQSPGPLVDLLHPNDSRFEWLRISFRANATGPLKALAGYGPDGTPGRMVISQTSALGSRFKGATADGFPAEFVEFRAVGR